MKKPVSITLATLLSIAVSGCAGRQAVPVTVVQDGDFSRNCNEIKLEVQSNNSQIKQLVLENANKNGKNALATGVAIVAFAPALFFLDLKGAAKKEFEALNQRNLHLANVAKNKGCPIQLKTLEELRKEVARERSRANPTQTPSSSR